MHARFVSCLLTFGLLCVTAAGLWAQSSGQGSIRAARVRGEVALVVTATGVSRPLAAGDTFGRGHEVTTAAGASAVLVLSNGASLTVGPVSRLAVDEFLQDPLGEDFAPVPASAEPSTSQTKLRLAYGEVTAQVKKLNTADGSSFEVQTQVGVAGIRGTTVRLIVRELPDGRLSFTIELVEGEMYFTPAEGGPTVTISGGEQLLVSGTVDPATGQVTIESSVLTPLDAAVGAVIQQIVSDAFEAGGEIVFTVGENLNDLITNLPPEVTPALPETTPGAGVPGSDGVVPVGPDE